MINELKNKPHAKKKKNKKEKKKIQIKMMTFEGEQTKARKDNDLCHIDFGLDQ